MHHQVKSVVWWATREPCGPVYLHWLALRGGMGSFYWQYKTYTMVVHVRSATVHLIIQASRDSDSYRLNIIYWRYT